MLSLGQPRLVVLAAGRQVPRLLQALKTISNQIIVLGLPTPELVLALADDEPAVQKVLPLLIADLEQMANGLRLRGRFVSLGDIALVTEALARAETLICMPSLEVESNFGLSVPEAVASSIRAMKGRRVLVGEVTASQPDQLVEAVHWCSTRFGSIEVSLINANSVQPLPPGRFYQTLTGAQARDLSDWAAPEHWDVTKLAVFLREAIGKR
jgi:hypothetical protein